MKLKTKRFSCLLIAAFLIAVSPSFAQTSGGSTRGDTVFYNKVIRLKKDAQARYGVPVLVGRVHYDSTADRYEIKTKEQKFFFVRGKDVEIVETYSQTFLPPAYNVYEDVYCCDIRQRENEKYFLEARIWAMYTAKDNSQYSIGIHQFTFGPELAAGFRFTDFGIGLGISCFRANSINRIPVFIHARYELCCNCTAPYLYAQAGTVFDNQSGVNALSPNNIFHTGPAIAGAGMGLDIALSSSIDLSFDIGYRYLHLPTKVYCGCAFDGQIFHVETHGVIARAGVTF